MNSKKIWDAKVYPLFLTLHKKFTIYEQQLSQYFHTKISNCIKNLDFCVFNVFYSSKHTLTLKNAGSLSTAL